MAPRGSYTKGKAKRDEILMAAYDVFGRRGYRGASIREIGEIVGLTNAGIFHYFTSKEELFVEVLRVREELGEARTPDLLEALRLSIENNARNEGLVHLFVTVSAEAIDPEHPGHDYFQARYRRLIALMRDRIEVGQAAGQITRSVDSTSIARMLVAFADGIQLQWLLDPANTDMLGIFDKFRSFIETGARQDDLSHGLSAEFAAPGPSGVEPV